jgi:purine-nucleoside phosphorylase
MMNLNVKYKELIDELKKQAPFKPAISLILGSGLGKFAESLEVHNTIYTSSLPGYPPSTVEGHEGKILFCTYKRKKILLFQGRIHFYEGYKISECILPSFISYKLGCRKILITNAAGGVNPNFSPGDLMLIKSFNGINIKKELTDLIGISSVEQRNQNFNFPSERFNLKIIEAALAEKIHLREGVYWYNKGPSYETPAEIRMCGKLGADAVGMSTVPEAVYASFLGLETASISCITNFAAGLTMFKLSHSEVTETADLIAGKFERLIKRIILNI